MERVEIFENEGKTLDFLAKFIQDQAQQAIAERKAFVVGLSGIFFFYYRSDAQSLQRERGLQ